MLQQILVFLISTLTFLYVSAILLRFLLALVRADFYNPLSQFLVQITNPILVPLRRYIPAAGKVDTASLVLAFFIKLIAAIIIALISSTSIDFFLLIIAVLADLMRAMVWIFMAAIIIQVVLSWVGNAYNNPLASLVNSLVEPILKPIRNIVPTIGVVDLSPLVAVLGLQVILMLLAGFPTI